MRLRFSKMHILGEDLVVIDGLTQQVRLTGDMVRFLADRRLGVGCQQVLVVEAPGRPEMDFRSRLFNRDGSPAADHYRAAYCLASFVWERRLAPTRQIHVEAINGPSATLEAQPDGQITLTPDTLSSRITLNQSLDLGDERHELSLVDLDHQSHAILTLPSVADAPLKSLGRRIQQQLQMAAGVNVGFMAVLSTRDIDLRVLQHNGSEARACPASAVAAVMAGRLSDLLDEEVNVRLPGGKLTVRWPGEGMPVHVTAEATLVYQGQIHW